MPKSSRHKSSKHSSREAKDSREYSDSEKDSSLKERTVGRVSKESSGSGEKRKLESKENFPAGNGGGGDYVDDYSIVSSSKRRKDRGGGGDDGGNDRWNGGGDEERALEGVVSRKSKSSGESKSSRRREESDGSKHRESRKESERERERERKGRSEDRRKQSAVIEKTTESNAQDLLLSPESENQLEARVRRKRDGSGDGDKHDVDIGDNNDRRRDDLANDVRLKEEKHKDERYRDKYREDVDRDNRHREDKQRDEHSSRDHANSRFDDKHLRDEKDAGESRQKKTKAHDSDRDREREYDPDEHDFDSGRDRDRDRYRERDRDRDYDHDRSRDRERFREHDGDWDRERNREIERDRDRRDRDRDRERDREREHNRECDHDRDRDLDLDGSHHDDRSGRYKDSRGKKRSPDERDEYSDAKSRGIKGHYPDTENKSLTSSRVEADAERGRSQSRQGYAESTISNKRRTSPSPSSHGGADDYRHSKQDDKYRDSAPEQRSKAISSREVSGFSGATERSSKYRSSERSNKTDEGHLGEMTVERSSSAKASPMGMMEKSPSSSNLDRRYSSRGSIRRSLDIEETGRRGSVGPRELSSAEDRQSRELPLEKPMVDDSSQMDLQYYNRTSQGGSSSTLPPPPAFRAGVGSPSFMGSVEDDSRGNHSGRYRRGDLSMGRGQGNAWRGPPNWSSPNGFIPFQHGPPHGSFPAMMPQFPSPSLFGVRPSMELNHSGIPYHISDADRFSSHLRPLGWQGMIDGTGPSHLHGWDGNAGAFRDEPHMYGGSDWDQNRHMMNGRGWETNSDMWKGENGDANMDLPSMSQKEDHSAQAPSDDGSSGKVGQLVENNHGSSTKSDATGFTSSPAKNSSKVLSKASNEKTSDSSKRTKEDDAAQRCRAYISKLDISSDLAGEELYSRCMSLLGTYKTVSLETESAVIVNLKDGGRAIPKSSKTLLSPPFFPPTNDSVFQGAINYYKKLSISAGGIFNGGKIDIFLKSNDEKGECNDEKVECNDEKGECNDKKLECNDEKVERNDEKVERNDEKVERNDEKGEESIPCDMDKAEGLVLTNDTEMPDAPKLTPDHQKPESVPHDDEVQEALKEKDSAPSPMVLDETHAVPDTEAASNQDSPLKSSEEPLQVFNDDKNNGNISPEQLVTEGADAHCSLTPDNAQQAATEPELLADDDKMDEEENKNEINNPVSPLDNNDESNNPVSPPNNNNEKRDLGDDTNNSPLISEAMMPGSNESESESVILNRIHHSPESTH